VAGFDSIDDWFEKGFTVKHSGKAAKGRDFKRDKVRTTQHGSPSSRGGGASSRGSKSKAANIKSVLKKAPEVMVKITGSNKGLAGARSHIDYISRNGEIELIDESGESFKGNKAVKQYQELLRVQQIPEEGKRREFLHVVFSMPKDTPVDEMKKAVAKFCKDEFSNRRYVMAFHDDTDHRHVHVCVGTRDIDRADEARLKPTKKDLMAWRTGFAAALRDEGIEAAASPRQVRFKVPKRENFTVRQLEKNNKTSSVRDGFKQDLTDSLKNNERPGNPFENNIALKRNQVIKHWDAVLKEAKATGNVDLVRQVEDILKDGQQRPASRLQAAFENQLLEKLKSGSSSELDNGVGHDKD
jgi:hypothetical protein